MVDTSLQNKRGVSAAALMQVRLCTSLHRDVTFRRGSRRWLLVDKTNVALIWVRKYFAATAFSRRPRPLAWTRDSDRQIVILAKSYVAVELTAIYTSFSKNILQYRIDYLAISNIKHDRRINSHERGASDLNWSSVCNFQKWKWRIDKIYISLVM